MKKKFLEIASGWTNYIFTDPKVEEKAKIRAKICARCPNAIPGTWSQSLPDHTITEVKGLVCKICTCPLTLACRSESKECPEGKW